MRSIRDDTQLTSPEEKLRAILAVTEKLNSERDLTSLLRLIAAEAARLLEADLASVFLLDEARRQLWSRISLDSNEVLRFDAEKGIAGEAIRTGQVQQVDDVAQDPHFFAGVDATTGVQTRNVLAVPLKNLSGTPIGVFEVLNKREGPFQTEDVELAQLLATQMAIALETSQLLGELRRDHDSLQATHLRLTREVQDRLAPRAILGTSPRIESVVRLIEQVADSSLSVLITGESGTGKELAAKAIHFQSPRAARPFIAINCAALPEPLLESEMFGVEKGVATGVQFREGKFQAADRGTLFLDEVGDLTLVAQAKLLRVLQERQVERIGGRSPQDIDVRVIAATNRDLAKAIQQGEFREDLYYRLNAVQIHMPPLRELGEDVHLLARRLLDAACHAQSRPPLAFSPAALCCLLKYSWPGNVRQLDNEMLRLSVLVRGEVVDAADLSESIRSGPSGASASESTGPLKTAVEALEHRMIEDALAECHHNQQKTATRLGLSRQGLIKKLKRYGLSQGTSAPAVRRQPPLRNS